MMWERVHVLAILLIFTNTLSFTHSSSNDYPHWVKFDPENGTLPANAIVGGYEDETLYIARAPYVGSLTPGKYIPSTHKAIISWGWMSHVANKFEILCGRNYKWVPTTTDYIPNGAVVGGYIQNSYEPLYIGRIHYKGQATIPGKVAVSHKVMYFAYDDKEIAVKYFEVLVETSKPAPREYPHWVKYSPTNGTLPADAIVGGYGADTNETLYIARAPHAGSLTPGKYIPSTHQAVISWGWWSHVKNEFEILVGHNYKWVPTTVRYIPDGAVVGGYIQDSYEPLFVGRVHYAGQLLPGKVAVSHGVLYFGYKQSEKAVKNFEILVFNDEVEEPTAPTSPPSKSSSVPPPSSTTPPPSSTTSPPSSTTSPPSSMIPPSSTNPPPSSMTTPPSWTAPSASKPAPSEYPHWVKYSPADGPLPTDAIVGGYGADTNETLYIARAPHAGSLTPGKYVPSTHQAVISWGWWSHVKNEFEILVGHNYKWVPTTVRYIPDGAVVGGYIQDSYEPLFVGRVHYAGQLLPGKVAVSHGVLYFGYKQSEKAVKNFEILVFNDEVEEPTASTPPPRSSSVPPPSSTTPPPSSTNLRPSSTNPPPSSTNPLPSSTTPPPSSTNPPPSSMTTPPSWTAPSEKPKITGEYNVTATSGQTVNIECQVTRGVPKPTISWQFKAETNLTFVSVPGSDNVLRLSNVDSTIAGTYKCVATNDLGHDEHLTKLFVRISQLQFTVDRRDPIVLDLTDTEDFELNCDFEAIEPANISWTFNGKLMDSQKSSRLTFAGNWGDYTCKVTTIHGTIQRSFNVTSSKCFIPREPKYVNTTPLILTINAISDYTTDYMIVEPGQTLIFSCPDSENETNHFEMFPLRHEIKAHCVKEDQFLIKDNTYKLSDLICAQEVKFAVIKKHQKCWTENNNSELLGVGFGFSELFEVCFDTANNIPLYIPGKISKSNRGNDVMYKWQKYGGLDAHRDTYTCDNTSSTCCYTKAQLLNARDVSTGPQQRSTFIHPFNAVPVWRPCDLQQSPWEVMEISVRVLTALKDDFKIWSGTYMPQNKNGTIIPRYLWKVVEKTIALIYINDPTPSEEDVLCYNLCGSSPPWPNEYKKYIYCCDLEDFLVRFGLKDTNVGGK